MRQVRPSFGRNSTRWADIELAVATEDIRVDTAWDARDPRARVIVNLGGHTRIFEAELEGGGVYLGPPTPGEMSILPAGRRLSGHYRGCSITYATLFLPDRDDGAIVHRLKHRDEFLFRGIERLVALRNRSDDLARMVGESIATALRDHLRFGYGAAPPPGPEPRLLRDGGRAVAEFVEAFLADKLTLAALATVAGLSVHDFLPAFRAAFGTTPAQYVIDRRLDRARWLLLNTSRSIAAIAFETGFSSHAHLTGTMSRRHGRSPRAVRGR